MHALQFSTTGDLAALSLVELPAPVAAADEVLVQVKAAGLNPSDVKNVLGRFPYTTLPRIPGRDLPGSSSMARQHWWGKRCGALARSWGSIVMVPTPGFWSCRLQASRSSPGP